VFFKVIIVCRHGVGQSPLVDWVWWQNFSIPVGQAENVMQRIYIISRNRFIIWVQFLIIVVVI